MIDIGECYERTEIMHDRTTEDLISRQAAIDILCRALHYNYEEGYAVTQMYSLPSVQLRINNQNITDVIKENSR